VVETAENQIDATNEIRWKRLVQGLSRFDEWHKPLNSPD
jgi:flagellar assembly protein FliH